MKPNALFKQEVDACEAILHEHLGRSMLDILYDEEGDQKLINQTAYTQPAIFALEYALAKLWMSWGVKPDYVMGHSVGEYVAAVIAGIMSLEDGLKLISERGRLMNSLPAGGVMAAVFAPRERIEELLEPWKGKLNVAAHNSPTVNTISGEAEALDAAMEVFKENKVKARKLVVSHAFHSHLMDPMLEEFAAFAAKLTYNEPTIPLISNVTCKPIKLSDVTPEYWCQHVRGTVGFHDSMKELENLGVNTFIEVGADVTLSGLGKQCLPGNDALWVSSLKRKATNWDQLLGAIAELHVNGVNIDWKAFESDYNRRKVVLPTYPFQRKRYYMNPFNFKTEASGMSIGTGEATHPLLGSALMSPMQEKLYLNQFTLEANPLIADHVIYNVPLLPATAYMEMGLSAAAEHFGTSAVSVSEVMLKESMPVQKDQRREVQSIIRTEQDAERLYIYSRLADGKDSAWTAHAEMTLARTADLSERADAAYDVAAIQSRLAHSATGDDFYAKVQEIGYHYSNRFHSVKGIWWEEREAISETLYRPPCRW